jgi:hypothetical protein
MMQPKRLSVKYFVQGDLPFPVEDVAPIFQEWIQQHVVEGLLIDVADYKHVKQGPGIVLIGDEGDYALDLRQGRPGLLYVRKRALPDTLEESLQLTFRLANAAAKMLERERALKELKFNFDQAEIAFLDRLEAPNTPETFEVLRESLQKFATTFFNNEAVQVESVETDPRKVFTVRIGVLQEAHS